MHSLCQQPTRRSPHPKEEADLSSASSNTLLPTAAHRFAIKGNGSCRQQLLKAFYDMPAPPLHVQPAQHGRSQGRDELHNQHLYSYSDSGLALSVCGKFHTVWTFSLTFKTIKLYKTTGFLFFRVDCGHWRKDESTTRATDPSAAEAELGLP